MAGDYRVVLGCGCGVRSRSCGGYGKARLLLETIWVVVLDVSLFQVLSSHRPRGAGHSAVKAKSARWVLPRPSSLGVNTVADCVDVNCWTLAKPRRLIHSIHRRYCDLRRYQRRLAL